MSNNILPIFESLEKDKGIKRDDLISAIVTAIKTAAQRGDDSGPDLEIKIDAKTGHIHAYSRLKVVDSVSDLKTEIHLEKARVDQPDVALGEIIEKEIDPASLGRITAQAVRQAVAQKIRQFEKERIYDDFKDMVGDIVTGTVRRRERNDIYVDIGQTEALLMGREQVPGEEYQQGDRIRCLLAAIESTPRGPELMLTRASPRFVRRLFEVEVTEIADGTVVIEAFAREPGYRTKMAVTSTAPRVDPVGACVGARGARVKSIVRELNGEKIDIINYFADPEQMVYEALKPAVPREVRIDERNHRIQLLVAADDLAIAIGRRGQNARLTSRLIGWKIDIEEWKEVKVDVQDEATKKLAVALGVDGPFASRLITAGFVSLDTFEDVEVADLEGAGFTADEATSVLAKVGAAQGEPSA